MKKLKKVLLIDDDDIVNVINKTVIEHAGFADEIIVQTTVDAAIHVLSDGNNQTSLPELIFLDVNMPEKNGWDFINEFLEIGFKDKEPKIIMLSSSINPKDKSRALETNIVVDFISKPISSEKLKVIASQF
ncbi:Response regulator receiver domain-containing protein [Ekhidna lutea]|uniref:Response regulator receiver domain-containing protein n=1 Tax=Ekhidna lutea TaxID=447679 RepID=A0A239FJK0_EKHLU|nr:response regulator [Ekhidna lutea]SNS57109.1 Response regulator receiver domain-containing protein [Ekhidna lutea]